MTNANDGFTCRLGQRIGDIKKSSFSESEYDFARIAVADALCVAIAAVDEPVSQIVRNLAEDMGGAEQASLIGGGKRVSVLQAAKINGATIHALDFDDTLQAFQGHPTAVILPAIFALAELRDKSYDDVLTSYLVGLEIGCLVSSAMSVAHYTAGWHGTATIGRIAAAAASAHLLELDAHDAANALAIAGTEAGGVKQSFGTMCKPYHAGMAAEGGVNAALLASRGLSAAPDLLEGELGFIALHHGANLDDGETLLNGRRPAELLAHKYHAACHCTHAPIEIALDLMDNENLTADEIESIDVFCSKISIDAAGKTIVNTGLDGKFSIPYAIARTFLSRETGIQGYTNEAVQDPAAKEFMNKVTITVDDAHREAGLRTTLCVRRKSGEVLSRAYDPMDHIPEIEERRRRLDAKFRSLCTPVIGKTNTQKLWKIVLDSESAMPVVNLFEPMTR